MKRIMISAAVFGFALLMAPDLGAQGSRYNQSNGDYGSKNYGSGLSGSGRSRSGNSYDNSRPARPAINPHDRPTLGDPQPRVYGKKPTLGDSRNYRRTSPATCTGLLCN